MNLSFSFLSLKNSFSNSAFFTISQTKTKNTVNFNRFSLNKFFFPFLYQKNQLSQITKSTFNNFLKTCIITDSYQTEYSSHNFYEQLVLKSFQATKINDCKFISCLSNDLDGGAILSFGELTVTHCSFEACACHKCGGAITCHDNLECISSFFDNCSSFATAAILVETNEMISSSFSLLTVVGSDCNRDSIIATMIGVTTTFDNTNISKSRTDGTYCGLYCEDRDLISSYNIFDTNVHSYYCSGIGTYTSNNIEIEKSTFINLSRKTEHPFGGLCIHINDARNSAVITQCSFIHLSTPGMPSIHFANHGCKYVISDCCFSTNESLESKTGIKFIDSYFDDTCKIFKNETLEIKQDLNHQNSKDNHHSHSNNIKFLLYISLGLIIIYLTSFFTDYLRANGRFNKVE